MSTCRYQDDEDTHLAKGRESQRLQRPLRGRGGKRAGIKVACASVRCMIWPERYFRAGLSHFSVPKSSEHLSAECLALER